MDGKVRFYEETKISHAFFFFSLMRTFTSYRLQDQKKVKKPHSVELGKEEPCSVARLPYDDVLEKDWDVLGIRCSNFKLESLETLLRLSFEGNYVLG